MRVNDKKLLVPRKDSPSCFKKKTSLMLGVPSSRLFRQTKVAPVPANHAAYWLHYRATNSNLYIT